MAYFACFLLSVVLGFVLTWYVRRVAVQRNWIPAVAAHHLQRPGIPRLGGVAIFLVWSALFTAVQWYAHFVRPGNGYGLPHQQSLYLFAAAAIVFLSGLYDDVKQLSPYWKLAAQVLAAGVLFAGGMRVTMLPVFFGSAVFGAVASFLATALWVAWITNAFNLLDGLDGLAAGSALFSGVVLLIGAILNHDPRVAMLALLLVGTVVGFLRFNFNPATIFLGDSGSLLLGFLLSAFALLGAQKSTTLVAVAIPVVSFGLPILDTAIAVVRRFLSGQPLFRGDLQHIHHRLLGRGFSHREVVILLYGVTAAFGLVSLSLLVSGGAMKALVLLVLGVCIWVGVQHLGYPEFFELQRVASRTMSQKQIITNNLAIRRAMEELRSSANLDQVHSILLRAFAENDFDRFELRLANGNGNVFHSWSNARGNDRLDDRAWNLNLQLIASDGEPCGSLKVYRKYGESPLMVDVNVLISAFPKVLADAIARSTSEVAASKTAVGPTERKGGR